ncbi:hypothetical protein P7L74_17555 [Tistrella mobilis]|uniref:hypothetical protein n=1 Tax=Tistrella mobilis TaxID=171437 RepID=UPI003558564E
MVDHVSRLSRECDVITDALRSLAQRMKTSREHLTVAAQKFQEASSRNRLL